METILASKQVGNLSYFVKHLTTLQLVVSTETIKTSTRVEYDSKKK